VFFSFTSPTSHATRVRSRCSKGIEFGYFSERNPGSTLSLPLFLSYTRQHDPSSEVYDEKTIIIVVLKPQPSYFRPSARLHKRACEFISFILRTLCLSQHLLSCFFSVHGPQSAKLLLDISFVSVRPARIYLFSYY